ncbi:MAG: BatA domain-containing protein [Flavobacteriales bacterium]|nr:BatA domain-containing protein [Flavobacteriales bacterium]
MIFAYPEFLFALAAISVPIIIHLFNFRRFKKVYFSDIRFLKDVEIETKSRNQLKNLLILLSRILAITFLVMAFARPVIPGAAEDQPASTSAVVYIDNSFSMNADGESGNLLEEAKARAIEIGSAVSNGSQLRLLTNDFDPKHYRDLSFEEFKNEVATVQPSPVVRSVDDILSRTSGMFDADDATALYYISDLQASSLKNVSNINDSLLSVYTIPTSSINESNVYIDSCWFQSPSRLPLQPDELHVRVRNEGTSDVENLSVKLTLNGVQRAVGTTNIGANSFEKLVLSFTNQESGIQFGEVSIQDYPITYDDRYLFSYDLANSISVLIVNGKSPSGNVARVFGSELNFKLTEVDGNALDYSVLGENDMVVLNELDRFSSGMVQELMKYVQDGGDLLFISSEKQDLTSTNELLLALNAEQLSIADSAELKVEGVNLQSELYKNVFTQWEDRIDLPAVKKCYPVQMKTNSASERLLTLSNGQPLLTAYRNGKGTAYVLAAPLKDRWTNFHRHALFVPTLYNMALNSSNSNTSMEVIGSDNLVEIASDSKVEGVLRMTSSDQKTSFVPELVKRSSATGIFVHDQIENDGHYLISSEKGDTIQSVSYNYNRAESEMRFLTPEEFVNALKTAGLTNVEVIESSIESLANTIKETAEGHQLWRYFLILALACLLIETILIRIL